MDRAHKYNLFQASRTANSCTQMRHGTSRHLLVRLHSISANLRSTPLSNAPSSSAERCADRGASPRFPLHRAGCRRAGGRTAACGPLRPRPCGPPCACRSPAPSEPVRQGTTPVPARGAGATGNSPLLQPDWTIAGCACRAHRQRPRPEPHSPINGCPCPWGNSRPALSCGAFRRQHLKGTFESRKNC